MKEQILNIIRVNAAIGNIPITLKEQHAAKEIELHVMEFIEWMNKSDCPISTYFDVIGTVYENDHEKKYTLEEVYQYWLTNIKDK